MGAWWYKAINQCVPNALLDKRFSTGTEGLCVLNVVFTDLHRAQWLTGNVLYSRLREPVFES